MGAVPKAAEDEEPDNVLLSREEVMRSMNLFRKIPAARYPEIVEKLRGYEETYGPNETVWNQDEGHNCIGVILQGTIQAADLSGKEPQIIQQFHAGECFGEAVAFGGQKSWVEIRAVKAARILYLQVDGLMADTKAPDFSLMKTNLIREMSNKLSILSLKNQILAEPRLRRRILMYLNVLPQEDDGYKEIPFRQKDLAQYLNANTSALSREMTRMREEGLIETEGRRVKIKFKLAEWIAMRE